MAKPGIFLVANYETAQPPEMAYNETPYCWVVETQYRPATDNRCSRIVADLAGHPGRRRYSNPYIHAYSSGVNHTEAALEFMRSTILPSGGDAQLVSMASTSNGMLFVFM